MCVCMSAAQPGPYVRARSGRKKERSRVTIEVMVLEKCNSRWKSCYQGWCVSVILTLCVLCVGLHYCISVQPSKYGPQRHERGPGAIPFACSEDTVVFVALGIQHLMLSMYVSRKVVYP